MQTNPSSFPTLPLTNLDLTHEKNWLFCAYHFLQCPHTPTRPIGTLIEIGKLKLFRTFNVTLMSNIHSNHIKHC